MSKSKLISVIAVLIIIAAAVFSYFKFFKTNGNVLGTNDSSYQLGVVSPLTGDGASLGQPYVNGLQIAVDEVNSRGGINGKKVLLQVQDGKFDSAVSADSANFLVNSKQVDSLSNIFFLPAQSASQLVGNSGVPFLYQAYPTSILDTNKNAFKLNFDPVPGCKDLAKYALQNNQIKKLGLLMAKVEYGDLCVNSLKQSGIAFNEYRYNYGETNFEALISKAQSEGVDKFMVIGIDFEFLALFKQIQSSNSKIGLLCVISSECITPSVQSAINPDILNNTLGIDFTPISQNTEFNKKYLAKYPGKSSTSDFSYGANGYEEAQILFAAYKKCQPGQRQCISSAIQNLKEGDYDNSAIGSKGFENRILKLQNTIYQYNNGRWYKV
ncbi:MAG: ABC transporter substrate-binding protein [bacterium]